MLAILNLNSTPAKRRKQARAILRDHSVEPNQLMFDLDVNHPAVAALEAAGFHLIRKTVEQRAADRAAAPSRRKARRAAKKRREAADEAAYARSVAEGTAPFLLSDLLEDDDDPFQD